MSNNFNPESLDSSADESAEVQLRELDEYGAVLERGELVTPEVWIERRPEARPALAALRGQFCLFEAKRLQPNAFGLETPPSSPDFTLPYVETPTTHKPEIPGHDLLDECGRGGMGVVFKARHQKLDRLVAVKVIRAGLMANEAEVRRFYAEAQSVAKLQHPNIVAVHDVGEHDGHHYFSMDYIDGASLADVIRTSPLPGKTAAHYMQIVAEAVHFAHQNGIFHRDLKPSNILLQIDSTEGNKGNREPARLDSGTDHEISASPSLPSFPSVQRLTPKITDFGLAKRLEGGPDLTSAGHALGTPSYMPPEQASGEHATVGPWNDVYSLGATLYALATGRPPFQAASSVETLRQVIQQEPVAPRQLNPGIDLDLETITLKCLQKEPAKRYGSAHELAADLGRYLRGEPILARPVSAPERLRRWSRRNPGAASALAAVLVAALILAGSVAVVSAKNDELGSANQAVTSKNVELEAANEAERQATAAAREQSTLALQTLQAVIFDMQRGLENLPGAGTLRRKLIQMALDRLKQVSDVFVARAAIDRNAMVALGELGDLFMRIGADERIALDTADELFGRALEIAEALATADPTNVQAQRDLAITLKNLGNVGLRQGKSAAAFQYYEKALEIRRKAAAADLTSTEAQRDLSYSLIYLGDMSLQTNKLKEALEFHRQALGIRRKLAALESNNSRARRDLAFSLSKVGDVKLQAGDLQDAREYYEQALQIDSDLAESDPNNLQAQTDLSVSLERLGKVHWKSNDLDRAIAHYEQALEICRKLAAAEPTSTEAQQGLSISFEKLGDVSAHARNWDAAIEHYQQSYEINRRLAATDPTDARAQRGLSFSLEKLGDAIAWAGNMEAALEYCRQALEICRKLALGDPSNAQAQRDLSFSFNKLGDVSRRAGKFQESLEYHQQALEISRSLSSADPTNAEGQNDVGASCYYLGRVHRAEKRYAKAIECYEEALSVLRRLDDAGKLAPVYKQNVAGIEKAIAECKLATLATGDWSAIDALPDAQRHFVLSHRVAEFAAQGKLSEAAEALDRWVALGPTKAVDLYNLACGHGVLVAALRAASLEPNEDEKQRNGKHVAAALAALRQAIAAGFNDFAHMQKDPDLAAIREHTGYKELLEQK